MSRVAKKPIALPKGVELNIQSESVSVKGPKGTLSIAKPAGIDSLLPVVVKPVRDAVAIQPGARLLHRVAVLDAVDCDRHVSLK